MHAHVCQNCRKAGKETVWVHGDECRGNKTAHKCPECGAEEWKQAPIKNGQSVVVNRGDAAHAHQHAISPFLSTGEILLDALLVLALVYAVIYFGREIISLIRQKKDDGNGQA
jgi:hypothetical protein